ncbi:cyclic nucleotide-binding-like protein [Pelagophyceae sp. CCMP2097]|nr:cyclic nucleotide-binding-like protein [Pelagophyceae sp. CCMP2097]
MSDSVSTHVVAQQQKWETYLEKHAIEKIYREMTAEMISAQPEQPVKFMFAYLQRNYPADFAASAASAPKSDFAANPDFVASAPYDEKEDDDDDDDADDYADYVEVKQSAGKKRGSVQAAPVHVEKNWVPPIVEKSAEKQLFLFGVLKQLFFLKELTKKEIDVLVQAMTEMTYAPGEVIIKQGAVGDMFYVVEDGICDIEVDGVGKVMEIPCADKNDAHVERRYFGELALLYDAPRAATVLARGAVTTWGLDRVTFKSILQDTEKKKIMLYYKFVQSIPIFQRLTIAETNVLCNSLTGKDFLPGDVIIRAGDPGNEFFIIEDGKAECIKAINGTPTTVATVTSGDFFGELALLRDAPRAATVKAITEVSLVCIDRATVERMLNTAKLVGLDTKDWGPM